MIKYKLENMKKILNKKNIATKKKLNIKKCIRITLELKQFILEERKIKKN